jgi:TATA element modulatory factor
LDSQLESQQEPTAQPDLETIAKAGAQEDAGTLDVDAASTSVVQPSSDSARPSMDVVQPTEISREPEPVIEASYSDPEAAQKIKQQADEIHQQLEKIDRLHANIAYLSAQLYDNASATAAAAKDGSDEKKEADKNVKIAQLLDEGGKLSKTEEKLRGDVKYLRMRLAEEKKDNADLTKSLEKAESDIRDLRISIQSAESREKSANDRINTLSSKERELETLRSEKADTTKEIQRLRRLLDEAERRADDADKQAQSKRLEEQMRVIAELNDELSNSRIEKRLVEDRVKSEMKDIKEEHNRQLEKSRISELELKAEIQVGAAKSEVFETNNLQNLEAKLEVLRLKSEEVSTNTATDSQAKLLRQIETLQSQYALAGDNWQGIEASLNNRLTVLEKERDELAKKEADARKKARELNSKARRFEEEVETAHDRISNHESEITQLKATLYKLETRLSAAEKDAVVARADLDRERKDFEATLNARIEEEKARWRTEIGSGPGTPSLDTSQGALLRADSSYSFNQRKVSATDISGRRSHTGRSDLSLLLPTHMADSKSRSRSYLSQSTAPFSGLVRTPTDPSLTSRGDSMPTTSPPLNGAIPPPIVPVADDLPTPTAAEADNDDRSTLRSSPQRTAAELFSVSTAAAGPSVQLVERMSATVRRLETEKAASREEIARLVAQRDEAREEVVKLMREVEGVRETDARLERVEAEMEGLKGKHDAALELLGEKTEECEELRADVADLKKIYRELVESMVK